MSALRIKGDLPTALAKARKEVTRGRHSSISTRFGGNSALSVTLADRTLGGKSYRLTPDKAERLAHGARPTNNSASFVPSGERVPMRNVQPGKNGYREMTERTAVN